MIRFLYFKKIACLLSAALYILPICATRQKPSQPNWMELTNAYRAVHNEHVRNAINTIELTRGNKIARIIDRSIVKLLGLENITSHELCIWWYKLLGISNSHLLMSLEYNCYRTTFDDVIALDHIKALLIPTIEYAKNPVEYSKNHKHITTNYHFYGCPGTGKTYVAEALMRELQNANQYIKTLKIPTDLLQTIDTQQLKDLIQIHAPCVVLIDNVDSGLITENNIEIFGCTMSPSPDRPVFVISTSNKIEPVNERIEQKIKKLDETEKWNLRSVLFGGLSLHERMQIVHFCLQKYGESPANFNVTQLAEKTEMCNFPFSMIEYCISQACLNAAFQKHSLTNEYIIHTMYEVRSTF